MSVLVAQNLEKSFGALTVLAGVSMRLEWRQRVGLVGPNGAGKTTLLQVLAGRLDPDRGKVSLARGVRIELLQQEQTVDPKQTVWAEAEAALASFVALEARMRSCEHEMASAIGGDLEAIMAEYAALRDRHDAMGGHDAMRDVRRVLFSLGFVESDFHRSCASLSGGQKTRLALARMLLSGTEILLLDEPTNHLDLDATEWLESFLSSFGGALIVVSHDRRFLDNVVTSVIELDRGKLTSYRGNFSAYWQQRQERLARYEEDTATRAREIARLEEFWRRNKAGQNRNQAWSRFKTAQRLRQQALEGPSRLRDLRVAISADSRGGNEVVIIEKVSKRFGERVLFSDLSLVVTRGQKIGVVGPNGSGKTTFLRIVLGDEPPTSGSARLGASVLPGYFAQETADLDPEMTVLETFMAAREVDLGEARSLLARFLFTGDDVFKTVAQLSGGEKNRLVLAQLALMRPNLLVLDEPTNHLDIAARHALAQLLKEYDGTILLASHDRYLLDEVTTHTLEIAGGAATWYDGNYSSYHRARMRRLERSAPPAPVRAAEASRPRNSFELARMRRRAAKAVEAAESRVQEAEDWLRRVEECLAAPQPGDDMVRLAEDYEAAQRELSQAMEAWEMAVLQAEELGLPV